MFDIGFSEMLVLAVVALVVLGPERLPRVARQAGQWLGRLRRYVDDVKFDLNRQMELSELKNVQSQISDAAREFQSGVQGALTSDQSAGAGESLQASAKTETDWEGVYAVRRMREKIADRRIEREKALGMRRPSRPGHR